jgi:hypothetical protein
MLIPCGGGYYRTPGFDDFKDDITAAQAYGCVMFCGNHNYPGDGWALSYLKSIGFNQWGIHLSTWLDARKEYLTLCDRYGIERLDCLI